MLSAGTSTEFDVSTTGTETDHLWLERLVDRAEEEGGKLHGPRKHYGTGSVGSHDPERYGSNLAVDNDVEMVLD